MTKTSFYKKRIDEIEKDLSILRRLVKHDPLQMREHPALRVIRDLETELAEILLLCDWENNDADEG
jgi:hypothetical protein